MYEYWHTKIVELTSDIDRLRKQLEDALSDLKAATHFTLEEDDIENHPLTTAYVHIELRERGSYEWWTLHGYKRDATGALVSFLEKTDSQTTALARAREILKLK